MIIRLVECYPKATESDITECFPTKNWKLGMQKEVQVGCLSLLLGALAFWRDTLFGSLSRIIGFDMPAETFLLLIFSQHTGHRVNHGAASPQNPGKTEHCPWNLCLGDFCLSKGSPILGFPQILSQN